jgi:NitT/TauT family transport system ATP-binding protein
MKPPSATPLLEVVGLGKRFDVRQSQTRSLASTTLSVLERMTFSIAEGEFVTLVGPSGAGKSTLLDILAHVERPTAGEVRFRGETIMTPSSLLEPGWRCQIGYVTQRDNLLPWRTARENVLFSLRAQKRLDADGLQKADALLRAVGLAGFEHFYPHELSGGMRKRVALARTLVYDPPVILLDEPFGALDAQTRARLHDDLLGLWSAKRKTIAFVTHDIVEAIALSDRVLVLSRAPSRVVSEHVIDLPRPRRSDRVITEPGFGVLYDRIREELA